MKKSRFLMAALSLALFANFSASAEIQEIDGQKWECKDGLCFLVEEDAEDGSAVEAAAESKISAEPRIAQGYMDAEEFLGFLRNEPSASQSPLAGKAWWLVLLLTFFGGLCMNLTPCVLPMVPINLMIVGRSAARGALYGLGIALAYGTLGLLAALGGMAFGEIQGNPYFNAAVAVLFFVLALALMGVFFIDFSKNRNSLASMRQSMWPGLFAFFMGVVSAVLAGACVAPILIAVLLLTADLFGKGMVFALALPFVLGAGMALPWPFAGAGLKVLPRPGAWMTKVNKLFGVVVLAFSAYYGCLAYRGFAGDSAECCSGAAGGDAVQVGSVAEFSPEGVKKPVLVDCWASWCKNCTAMEKTTLADGRVRAFLKDNGWTLIKLKAEDLGALKALPGCAGIKGLPAFLIYE